MFRSALAVVLFAASAATLAAQGDERVTAPAMLFTPPAAGTYTLPPMFAAPAGRVLDERGYSRSLREFTTGRVTLFSFVYTTCGDPAGCPLAFSTLAAVREKLALDPVAARATRFVSVSFDPEHDTPAVMQLLARHFAQDPKGPSWHFLTTASYDRLAPMLEGFGQDAAMSLEDGAPRRIDHTLRVFLLDRRARVREIYSSAYLMPEVIVNDIRTLLTEAR
jgi:protein SCO1/2